MTLKSFLMLEVKMQEKGDKERPITKHSNKDIGKDGPKNRMHKLARTDHDYQTCTSVWHQIPDDYEISQIRPNFSVDKKTS